MRGAGVGVEEDERGEEKCDQDGDGGSEVSDPAADAESGDVDGENDGKDDNGEGVDEEVIVGDPRGFGAESIAEAGGGHGGHVFRVFCPNISIKDVVQLHVEKIELFCLI